MVRSTKRCLRKIIGQAKLSCDELLTTLTEVEMVLNSRPFSYVSAHDHEEPLTPSHLRSDCRPSSRHLNLTLNRFWKRWKHEYLLELREAHRYHIVTDATPVKVGDVVVVHSDNQPRGFWKLARVVQTITGQDGKMRAATVRVANRQGHPTTLPRPIQCLYPLEIRSKETVQLQPTLSDPNPDPHGVDASQADPVTVRQSTGCDCCTCFVILVQLDLYAALFREPTFGTPIKTFNSTHQSMCIMELTTWKRLTQK